MDKFNERADAACLRRDQWITRTLERELPNIKREIPNKNSPAARRYIDTHRRILFSTGQGSTQISLALNESVSQQLQSVCDEKNIHRETLLNRLIMLLSGDEEVIAGWELRAPSWSSEPEYKADMERLKGAWSPELEAEQESQNLALELDMLKAERAGFATFDRVFSPLGRIVDIVVDPLLRYRWMLELRYREDLANMLASGARESDSHIELMRASQHDFTPFGMLLENPELIGLNCYLSDSTIRDIQTSTTLPVVRLIKSPKAITLARRSRNPGSNK